MAMGKRRQRQEALFVMADGLPRSAGHPFYQQLNALLAEADFDHWIERRCRRYYEQEEKRGQPSIPPGVCFRMLLVGYFEGIDSQRGIAWRCADSLSLRQFLGIPLGETTPDPKTLSNTRRLPEEVFDEAFQFVLDILVVAARHWSDRGRLGSIFQNDCRDLRKIRRKKSTECGKEAAWLDLEQQFNVCLCVPRSANLHSPCPLGQSRERQASDEGELEIVAPLGCLWGTAGRHDWSAHHA